jgi:hypothetical protein
LCKEPDDTIHMTIINTHRLDCGKRPKLIWERALVNKVCLRRFPYLLPSMTNKQ